MNHSIKMINNPTTKQFQINYEATKNLMKRQNNFNPFSLNEKGRYKVNYIKQLLSSVKFRQSGNEQRKKAIFDKIPHMQSKLH